MEVGRRGGGTVSRRQIMRLISNEPSLSFFSKAIVQTRKSSLFLFTPLLPLLSKSFPTFQLSHKFSWCPVQVMVARKKKKEGKELLV